MENNIKKLRVLAGLSQEALGERIGITKSTVNKLEKGNMSLTTRYIEKLCQALECSPEELYTSELRGGADGLVYAIKELLKLLLNEDKKPITRERIRRDLIAGVAYYDQAGLKGAAAVLDDLLGFVEGKQPQENSQKSHKPLRLAPPV